MKLKFKLRGKLVGTVITPVLLLGVAVMQLSKATVTEVLTDKLETSLLATVTSVNNTLEYAGNGAFAINGSGDLVKGDFNISKTAGLVDSIKEESGVEVSIFFGDTRYLTSLRDEDGNRLTEKANDAMKEQVLKNGENYFDPDVEVAGKNYLMDIQAALKL